MREIRFRAWTGREMYYQEDQYLGSFVRRAVPKIIMAHNPADLGANTHESYLPNGGDICEYLMQYTGLRDKNGREIYEGDIVRYNLVGNKATGVVKWDEAQARFVKGGDVLRGEVQFKDLSSYMSSTEVIGNTYENPELLP